MTSAHTGDLSDPLALARGQFVYGPAEVLAELGWKSHSLGMGRWVSAHPDTEVTVVVDGSTTAALIGMALDPHHPQRSNSDILRAWLAGDPEPADLPSRTFHSAGRWLLIVRRGESEIAFGDCAMTYPLHYPIAGTGALPWISSSETVLARCVPAAAEEDPWFRSEILDGFCTRIRPGGLVGLPLDRTLYTGIRSLVPNHWLDLNTGTSHRFWPLAPIAKTGLDDAIDRSAALLRGIVQAAAHRRPLTLGLTAGHDSRVLAGAMKHAEHPLGMPTGHTITNPFTCGPAHFDVHTGILISHALGLHHTIVRGHDAPDPHWTRLAESISAYHPPLRIHKYGAVPSAGLADALHVNGNVSEIVRSGWQAVREVRGGKYTIHDIMSCCALTGSPSTAALYKPWLAEATRLKNATGLDELEQLYWEWKLPRIVGPAHSIRTLMTNIFSAFSCNEMIHLQLGVSTDHRGRGGDALHEGVIRALAPELADLPYNPFPRARRLKQNARHWAAVRYNRVLRAIGKR